MSTRRADVYATARGPLARLASPLAARARARRHAHFFSRLALAPGARVLDVGCGALGLRGLEPSLDITGVDLAPRPTYPGPFVQADATHGLPFDDGEFDLAYSSSVIEHIAPHDARRVRGGAAARRPRLVRADARLLVSDRAPRAAARAPTGCRRGVRRPYWRLGAAGEWEDIRLLRRRELEALFGPAQAERLGPLVKSWVCVHPPAPGGA